MARDLKPAEAARHKHETYMGEHKHDDILATIGWSAGHVRKLYHASCRCDVGKVFICFSADKLNTKTQAHTVLAYTTFGLLVASWSLIDKFQKEITLLPWVPVGQINKNRYQQLTIGTIRLRVHREPGNCENCENTVPQSSSTTRRRPGREWTCVQLCERGSQSGHI